MFKKAESDYYSIQNLIFKKQKNLLKNIDHSDKDQQFKYIDICQSEA